MIERADYNVSGVMTPAEEVRILLLPNNSTIVHECDNFYLPSYAEYHRGINEVWLSFAITMAILGVMGVIGCYLDILRRLISKTASCYLTNSIMVISLYPVVSLGAVGATVFPRAQFVFECVTHIFFMMTLYHMFCLVINYAGGETGYIALLEEKALDSRVGPCCCWPCCFFLPAIPLSKSRLKCLRLLVLQAAIVQSLIYIMYLVIRSESRDLFHRLYNWMIMLVVASVLSSIWGLVITITPTFDALKHFYVKQKYIVFQLVLVLSKFQLLIARIIASSNLIQCQHSISPSLYTNLVYNILVIWEMLLLCCLARKLYSKDIHFKESNLAEHRLSLQLPPTTDIKEKVAAA